MASTVSICNLALIRLGQGTIGSLSELSAAAKNCNALFDEVRRTMLRDHPWNFATKFASLALTTNTPEGYDYEYALPTDCLRVIRLFNASAMDDEDELEFDVRGRTLVTDVEDAKLRYTYNVTDTTKFDDQFSEAFSYRLAADLALPLTGKVEYQQAMFNAYQYMLANAQKSDARERRVRPNFGNKFLDARG